MWFTLEQKSHFIAVAPIPYRRDWLHKHLSAAFTVGSLTVDPKKGKFFRRPKLWLCTGLVKIENGTYEVVYKKGKGGNLTLTDHTGTIPVEFELGTDRSPESKRITGITQSTIIGAQWMLLYCRNVKSKKNTQTPYEVKLNGKYAVGTVKGAEEPFAQILTSTEEIKEAELKGKNLTLTEPDEDLEFSEEEEEDKTVTDDHITDLFELDSPESGAQGFNQFERFLGLLYDEKTAA